MSPFLNEDIIMDLMNDGQLTKTQIEGYFKVKEKYRQYIIMIIIIFRLLTLCQQSAKKGI